MTDSSTTKLILYMEDDPGLARLFQKKMQAWGYSVDIAPDGETGLEMFRNGSYDVLAVDHQMPKLTGIEVIRRLVQDGLLPPTVVITGGGSEMVAVEALKLGASDYIIKDPDKNYLDLMPVVVEKALQIHAIVEQKRLAEKALRESERKFRDLAHLLPQFVYEMDNGGRITFMNRAGLEGLGYTEEDVEQGLPAAGLLSSSDQEVFERDAKKVFAGEALHGTEYTAKRRDGTTFPLAVYAMPIEKDGQVAGVRGVAIDVTERKRTEQELRDARNELERRVEQRTAELASANMDLRREIAEREHAQESLRQSEERFRTIFECAGDPIFIKDRFLAYVLVNPCMEQLLDLTAAEIVGKFDEQLFGREAARLLREWDLRVLKGETIEGEHTRSIRGAPMTFLDTRAPIRDGKGEVIGICGVSRSITERKRTFFPPIPLDSEYTSRAMGDTLAAAQLAARSDSIILLTGESGSGKDYLARYIHDHSPRASGPFFAINCAAVASDIAESELFGHEAGAFTGAARKKKGLLELAEGGTLLLNEIGELSPRLQAKLLSFLDTRSFTRVGGEKTVTVSARLIAATNRDLEAEAAEGRFRRDLFYRLNVFAIRVPSLRDRSADIPVLVRQLLAKLCGDLQIAQPPEIDAPEISKLRTYPWPGNVRELRNVLERALIHFRDGKLQFDIVDSSEAQTDEWNWRATFPPVGSLTEAVKNLKESLINEALQRTQGNRTEAARLLGVTRDALKRQMQSLGYFGSK
jgi:PAS domain S-box-containing protein